MDAAKQLYPAGAIHFQMDEPDGRGGAETDHGLPRRDDRVRRPAGPAQTPPRLWGTFPRVLGRYVREEGILSPEQAVHKMTGLSAATFRLKDRGLIREGFFADLVLFDPATFEDPIRPAAGIEHVLVNGTLAWSRQAATDTRAGHFLARAA